MKQRNHKANSTAHVNLRMERWHRRSLYAAVVALTASGILWLTGHYLLRSPGEFGLSIHPLEPWSMKLHGAAALVTTFFVGSVMNSHIRRAWRSACNRTAGCSLVAVLALLTITGYCLWYVAGESNREIWSMIHWILGLTLPLLLVGHIIRGRWFRRQQAAQ